jgi:hypothetical protein
MKKISTLFCVLALFCLRGVAQQKSTAVSQNPPALAYIKEPELKKDIFELAGDAFRGRRAGTLDEMRAAAWVAQTAQEEGLKPAGDDGTYFQFFNLKRTRIADRSTILVNNQPLKLWHEVWVSQPVDARLDGQVVWLNSMADTSQDLTGKIVAMNILPPNPLPAPGISLLPYRYALSAIRQQSLVLRRKGVAAVILVADAIVEEALPFAGHNLSEGLYQIQGGPAQPNTRPLPVLVVHSPMSSVLPGASFKANLIAETFLYPSVNVVAKVEGTDPKLKSEYVLFSGHHDHDGVGTPIKGDSIWNGADDNASVTVAMLAIGRAWVHHPSKRSALFVWHGAEERGLLGSRWYAAHPTVPKESIVAVLNGDMIGRNNPDSAALLGVTPPHRNSIVLVNMAFKANDNLTHFKIDTTWDNPKQPEGWYFRSDHLPYAQAGIPSIFFTTLLHPDYHTPRDEPAGIDIEKLANMSKWMYATGWMVAETPEKPALDPKAAPKR